MEFVTIDVETANPDMTSICQIGIAHYRDGIQVNEWMSYINPEQYFSSINISIHGINEKTVSGAPTFKEALVTLYEFMDNQVAVCHSNFDRLAIKQAANRCDERAPNCRWLDSSRVVRRVWSEFSQKGYGLGNVCNHLGYEFKHHDALEDARAVGHILMAASQKGGLDLEGLLQRVTQPIDPTTAATKAREGNSEGALYGEVVAFTGALEIPRREAADMASKVGCEVGSGVTKKTTLLIVGDQDVLRLVGHEKSSKHRKAEKLISEGIPIRIMRESDFKELVGLI